MKIKREERNKNGDQMHVRIHKIFAGGGGGAEGVQLQTRVGPTKFHHFKTHNFENRGRGFGPRSPSGSAHEMLFLLCAVVN